MNRTLQEITPQDLDEKIIGTRQEGMLVEVSGNHCASCQVIEAMLATMISSGELSLPVFKLNIDTHPEFAQEHKIRSLPTLMLFRGDAPVRSTPGLPNRTRIKQFAGEAS